METQTTQLIEMLAQKLGTTTEYLWSVLIKQAPIDASITLFQILLIILFGVTLYKLHRKFSRELSDSDYSLYDKYEESLAIPMVIGTLMFAGLLIAALFSLNSVINGYFNPEYWALKEILNSVSGCD